MCAQNSCFCFSFLIRAMQAIDRTAFQSIDHCANETNLVIPFRGVSFPNLTQNLLENFLLTLFRSALFPLLPSSGQSVRVCYSAFGSISSKICSRVGLFADHRCVGVQYRNCLLRRLGDGVNTHVLQRIFRFWWWMDERPFLFPLISIPIG